MLYKHKLSTDLCLISYNIVLYINIGQFKMYTRRLII